MSPWEKVSKSWTVSLQGQTCWGSGTIEWGRWRKMTKVMQWQMRWLWDCQHLSTVNPLTFEEHIMNWWNDWTWLKHFGMASWASEHPCSAKHFLFRKQVTATASKKHQIDCWWLLNKSQESFDSMTRRQDAQSNAWAPSSAHDDGFLFLSCQSHCRGKSGGTKLSVWERSEVLGLGMLLTVLGGFNGLINQWSILDVDLSLEEVCQTLHVAWLKISKCTRYCWVLPSAFHGCKTMKYCSWIDWSKFIWNNHVQHDLWQAIVLWFEHIFKKTLHERCHFARIFSITHLEQFSEQSNSCHNCMQLFCPIAPKPSGKSRHAHTHTRKTSKNCNLLDNVRFVCGKLVKSIV